MHIAEGEGLAINAGDLALSLVTGSVVHDPALDAETKLREAEKAREDAWLTCLRDAAERS